MRTNSNPSNLSRIGRSVLLAGGVLLAGAVAFSPAAEARDHQDRGRAHHAYRYVEVPRRMHAHHRREFRHAYAGRTYYRPHHHQHAVYRYPVVIGVVPLPRVVLGFNVRPGIHVHAGAY